MPSSASSQGGSAGQPIGPLSPWQQLTSIHFPTKQTSTLITVQFDGACLAPQVDPCSVYFMSGQDIFKPTKQTLLGTAFTPITGSFPENDSISPMNGTLAFDGTDNIWFGVLDAGLEGGGFTFENFQGTFTVTQRVSTTSGNKDQPDQVSKFTFDVPDNLPNIQDNENGAVSLGWRYYNQGVPLYGNLPPAFSTTRIIFGIPSFYAVFGLTFNFKLKQVSVSTGVLYDQSLFNAGG